MRKKPEFAIASDERRYYCFFSEESGVNSGILVYVIKDYHKGTIKVCGSYKLNRTFVRSIELFGLIEGLKRLSVSAISIPKQEIESIPVIVKELKNHGYGKYFLPTPDFDLATQFRYSETKYVIS